MIMPDAAGLMQDLLMGFPRALRHAGLVTDPARAASFLAACTAVPIRSMNDLARVGRITLTSSPDDFPIYDQIFKAWFSDASGFVADLDTAGEDETAREKPNQHESHAAAILPGDTSGKDASPDEAIGNKSFRCMNANEASMLERIRREAAHLPALRSRKWRPASRGSRIDLAETCAQARHTLGETLRLFWMERPEKPRRILLLIDISGSMQSSSQYCLRAAHAVSHARPDVETFCIGTRLSRVTQNLRHRDADAALSSLGQRVFDFDGGTRLGMGLGEFLAISKYAALVRGAFTIVLSDGLERGEITPMVKAVERLGRLSHRLIWLTPLANDPGYVPATRALAACLPFLDAIGNAGSLSALAQSLSEIQKLEQKPRRQAKRLFTQQGQIA